MDNTSPSSSGLLCAYWPLDLVNELEGLFSTPDLAGGSYDLSLQNMDASTFGTEGGRQAVSFNGVDQLLFRTHDPGDDLPINKHAGFTISLWVKATGSGQNDRRFFSEGSTVDALPLFNMGTQNAGLDGRVNLYLRNSANAAPALQFTTGAPLDNTWRHIAYTSNAHNRAVSIYLDGILDRDNLAWRDLRTDLNVTSIGGIVRGASSYWINGFVDDISLWKKVFTEEEIMALAEVLAPLFKA